MSTIKIIKEAIQKHENKNPNEKSYECDLCNRKLFLTQSSLVKHYEKIHKEIIVESEDVEGLDSSQDAQEVYVSETNKKEQPSDNVKSGYATKPMDNEKIISSRNFKQSSSDKVGDNLKKDIINEKKTDLRGNINNNEENHANNSSFAINKQVEQEKKTEKIKPLGLGKNKNENANVKPSSTRNVPTNSIWNQKQKEPNQGQPIQDNLRIKPEDILNPIYSKKEEPLESKYIKPGCGRKISNLPKKTLDSEKIRNDYPSKQQLVQVDAESIYTVPCEENKHEQFSIHCKSNLIDNVKDSLIVNTLIDAKMREGNSANITEVTDSIMSKRK